MKVFTTARWRLTTWFVVVLALILLVIGSAVYLTTRAVLFQGVEDDLHSRASREVAVLAARVLERTRQGEPARGVTIGPAFTAGGYFYALVDGEGHMLAGTQNVDPSGLAGQESVVKALEHGPTYSDTVSSDGEDLRVFVVPLRTLRERGLVLEVGRSVEPEQKALRRLVFILVGGGFAGLVLALLGGYLLAGRALAPIGAAMKRQRGFVADASHELRTPLSLVRASAELLKRHRKKRVEANMAAVDDIIAESDRLGSLVSQMLTLALADADRSPFNFSAVALHEVVEDVGRRLRTLAEAKGLDLKVEPAGSVWVRGDETRLRELLTILLENAVRFTEPGGTISVKLMSAANRAVIRVSDTGRGIPADALPHVFERFYRADRARSRADGGAGLGLAIAKWIVDNHRGSIRVASKLGEGTTFTVELPTQRA